MDLFIGLATVLASIGVLYYMGKSGFTWGSHKDEQ